jgi:hypothetical protein
VHAQPRVAGVAQDLCVCACVGVCVVHGVDVWGPGRR